jgi:acetyl-CoA C-acetyltransferase
MKVLDGGRISIAALALGIAEGAHAYSVNYAREREAFGKSISEFQAIQWMIADAATEIAAARHLIYESARLKDAGEDYGHVSAMAKLFASEMAMRVTNNAMQILGGYGYCSDYPVERMYRDAKLCTMSERIVISAAARTPVGKFQGALSPLRAPELGATVVRAVMERAGLEADQPDEVIMGCVLPAGLGQNPARQAAIYGGVANTVSAMTINKVCGSGLRAVVLGAQAIKAGDVGVVIAGGMESMSNVPYALMTARGGFRLGHQQATDLMVHDGLWDIYNDFHMGMTGELVAEKYSITREEQDAYAANSHAKAVAAAEAGKFKAEIVPVEVKTRKGNASSINDGASAVVVASETRAKELGLKAWYSIEAYATGAREPEWVMMAPVKAIQNLMTKTGQTINDFDVIELNEAFSVQAIAVTRELGCDLDRVNVNGGAVALGHPIGASGARVLTTLLYAMEDRGAETGLAALCLGGGDAVALSVRRIA